MKDMTDTFETQGAIPDVSFARRVSKNVIAGCQKRWHKMGANETISSSYENAFVLKTHREGKEGHGEKSLNMEAAKEVQDHQNFHGLLAIKPL
jgi:hypothetical protein